MVDNPIDNHGFGALMSLFSHDNMKSLKNLNISELKNNRMNELFQLTISHLRLKELYIVNTKIDFEKIIDQKNEIKTIEKLIIDSKEIKVITRL